MTGLPQPGQVKFGLVIDLDTCVGCHACATACKEWNTSGHSAPLPDFSPYGAEPDGVWFNRIHSYEAGEGAEGRTIHFPKSCLHCEEPACVTVCPTGASYKRAEDGIVLVNADICIGCKLCSWACPYGAREFDADAGVMKKCTLCIDRIYNENLDVVDRVPACVQVCPVGARHFGDLGDESSAVSRLVEERGGFDLLPEMGYRPVNKYLPRREPVDSFDAEMLAVVASPHWGEAESARSAEPGEGADSPSSRSAAPSPYPLPRGERGQEPTAVQTPENTLLRWLDRLLSL